MTPVLQLIFRQAEKQETLPNVFFEARITLILKPHKDIARKQN